MGAEASAQTASDQAYPSKRIDNAKIRRKDN